MKLSLVPPPADPQPPVPSPEALAAAERLVRDWPALDPAVALRAILDGSVRA